MAVIDEVDLTRVAEPSSEQVSARLLRLGASTARAVNLIAAVGAEGDHAYSRRLKRRPRQPHEEDCSVVSIVDTEGAVRIQNEPISSSRSFRRRRGLPTEARHLGEISIINCIEAPRQLARISSNAPKRRRSEAVEEVVLLDPPTAAEKPKEDNMAEAAPVSCPICLEQVEAVFSHTLTSCSHAFCQVCLRVYVAEKIESRASLPLTCPLPDCRLELAPEEWTLFLDDSERERLGEMEREAAIPGDEAVYCPNTNCGKLLAGGGGDAADRPEPCPYCRTEICPACRAAWHEGVTCAQYRMLPDDMRGTEDRALVALAASSGWKQCPKCRHMVQRSYGCDYMACRCGAKFCYSCGHETRECQCRHMGPLRQAHGEEVPEMNNPGPELRGGRRGREPVMPPPPPFIGAPIPAGGQRFQYGPDLAGWR